jgi:hypothetical protein
MKARRERENPERYIEFKRKEKGREHIMFTKQ